MERHINVASSTTRAILKSFPRNDDLLHPRRQIYDFDTQQSRLTNPVLYNQYYY